ncbi:MAG: hypothetical protein ACQETV_00825 [Actinomycetota bacterium]
MAGRIPLPVRASVRDLLTDLLGRSVEVRQAADPLVLSPSRPALLATYRDDDGGMAVASACELPLAAGAGGAIGMMSAAEVAEALQGASALEGDLEEFFHEVANVMGKLLNTPTSPHVALSALYAVPGEVPVDVARVVLAPQVRLDYRVDVDGYGDGTMTLLGG